MSDDVPRPRASPRIEAERLEEIEEPKTDPAIIAIRTKMRGELNWQGAKLTVAMCVVAVGTAFGAYRVVLSEAMAQTDAGMAPVVKRVEVLEQQQSQLRGDVHEVQQDIRSLYRAVMTGRPQERLEKPPPTDGGK